jgi:two-component system cell cycle response regulator
MTSHQPATIFIAEAAPHHTQSLVAILAAAGYQTRSAPQAKSLLDLLKQPPDLVLIQVVQENDGGYRLCQQIKANPALAHLPIILVGTAEALANPTQVFASGGDDYVIGPAIAADVITRVRRQLEAKGLGVGAIAPANTLAPRPPLLKASLQRIHNSLDLDAIFSTAVGDVRQQTQADRVVIYQFRNDGQGVITHEAVVDKRLSVLNRQVNDACFDQDHAITYWSGRVGQIDDVAALGQVSQCYRDMLLSFGIQANLVVPIIHNLMGQTRYLWGLIIVHQCHQPRRWSAEEIEMLRELSAHLAIAIQQSRLFNQVERLAHLDGLTQIANRREFDRYLTQEWQRLQREQSSLALVLADVDHFKGFNDTYGHLAGDDCLRAIGQLLDQVTKRPADLAARYGGEEFALILPNTCSAGAIALVSEAQTHLNRLAIPNRASPLYGQVTLSFGVTALVPTLALSPEVLMQRADQALYAAKKAGRNGYCLWSETIESDQEHSAEGAR